MGMNDCLGVHWVPGVGREETLELSPASRHSVSPPTTGLAAR